MCTKCSTSQKMDQRACKVIRVITPRGTEGHLRQRRRGMLAVSRKNDEHRVRGKEEEGKLKTSLRPNTEEALTAWGRGWVSTNGAQGDGGATVFGRAGKGEVLPRGQGVLAHWPYSVFHFPWWTQGSPGYFSSEKGKDSFLCCHHSRRNQKLEYHHENLLGRSSLSAEVRKGPRARAVDKAPSSADNCQNTVNTCQKLEGIRGVGSWHSAFWGWCRILFPPDMS